MNQFVTISRLYQFSRNIIKATNSPLSNIIKKQEGEAQVQMVRLSKWISHQSICSRREAQQIIQLGLVRINGKRIFENQLIPYNAEIKAFTELGLQKAKPITKLWMINKPRGCICSHKDPQKRPSVYDLLPPIFKSYGHIISVGRLDFNSQGLLLLTNDSVLKQLLEHPDANLDRFYRVKVHGRVTQEKIDKMSRPMIIKGQQYGPLKVDVKRQLSTNVWLNVSMKTGKNRQIRRIMQKCDLQVSKLIRLGYGPFKLNNLPARQIVELPISQGLDRKLKKTKAENLSQKGNTFIQIDVREKAIEYAQLQVAQRKMKQNYLGQAQKSYLQGRAEQDSEDE